MRKERFLDRATDWMADQLAELGQEEPDFAVCLNVAVAARLLEDAARHAATNGNGSLAGVLFEHSADISNFCQKPELRYDDDCKFH